MNTIPHLPMHARFRRTATALGAALAALAMAACGGGNEPAQASTRASTAPATPARHVPPAQVYAHVRAIEPIVQQEKPTGAGAVMGGVLGAVVGNQIGDGNGRKVATVAGAAGGAYVGNHIEKTRKRTVVGYRVRVEMPNGDSRSFRQSNLNGLEVGDRVRVEGDRLVRT